MQIGLQYLVYKIDACIRLTYAVKYFLCSDDSQETYSYVGVTEQPVNGIYKYRSCP